jgi:hypothetical protein
MKTANLLLAFGLLVGGAGCHRRSEAAAAPRVQARNEPMRHLRQGGDDRKPSAAIDLVVDGKPTSKMTAAELDATPVLDLVNKNGEARQGWSLHDLASKFVGPQARVVAVVGSNGQKFAVDSKDWQDSSKFLVLKVSHKGDYKLHWASRDGSSDDAVLKGVREIDVAR